MLHQRFASEQSIGKPREIECFVVNGDWLPTPVPETIIPNRPIGSYPLRRRRGYSLSAAGAWDSRCFWTTNHSQLDLIPAVSRIEE